MTMFFKVEAPKIINEKLNFLEKEILQNIDSLDSEATYSLFNFIEGEVAQWSDVELDDDSPEYIALVGSVSEAFIQYVLELKYNCSDTKLKSFIREHIHKNSFFNKQRDFQKAEDLLSKITFDMPLFTHEKGEA